MGALGEHICESPSPGFQSDDWIDRDTCAVGGPCCRWEKLRRFDFESLIFWMQFLRWMIVYGSRRAFRPIEWHLTVMER